MMNIARWLSVWGPYMLKNRQVPRRGPGIEPYGGQAGNMPVHDIKKIIPQYMIRKARNYLNERTREGPRGHLASLRCSPAQHVEGDSVWSGKRRFRGS